MKNLISIIYSKFKQATEKAYPKLVDQNIDIPIEVTTSTQARFGHYQYNTAMKLTKLLQQPPHQIAEKIIASLETHDEMIAKLEIAGPGFINIFLNPKFLSKKLDTLLRDPIWEFAPQKKNNALLLIFPLPM